MNGQQEVSIVCPYCGEPISVLVDPSIESQRYVEDCEVCCQPMLMDCMVDGDGQVSVEARRGDD
jgi:hypothetical protein